MEEIARFVGVENIWYCKKPFLQEMNVSEEEYRGGVRTPSEEAANG